MSQTVLAIFRAQAGIFQQKKTLIGNRAHRSAIDEQPRLAVNDRIGNPAGLAAEDGFTTGACLQKHQSESFRIAVFGLPVWHDKEVANRVILGNFVLRDRSGEDHRILHMIFRSQPPQMRRVIALTDEQINSVGNFFKNHGQGLNHPVLPLALVQPRQGQEYAPLPQRMTLQNARRFFPRLKAAQIDAVGDHRDALWIDSALDEPVLRKMAHGDERRSPPQDAQASGVEKARSRPGNLLAVQIHNHLHGWPPSLHGGQNPETRSEGVHAHHVGLQALQRLKQPARGLPMDIKTIVEKLAKGA